MIAPFTLHGAPSIQYRHPLRQQDYLSSQDRSDSFVKQFNIHFGLQKPRSLEENLEIGRQVLDTYKKEFGSPRAVSSLNDTTERTDLEAQLNEMRQRFRECKTIEEYGEALPRLVKEYNIANCGEAARLVCQLLEKAGIDRNEFRQILVIARAPDRIRIHELVVLGSEPVPGKTSPKTWDKNAVAIDARSNTCTQAEDYVAQLEHDIFKGLPLVIYSNWPEYLGQNPGAPPRLRR